MHLAELNIGRLHHELDHDSITEFRENLDRINALAERSPGFVWRLKGDNGNATSFRISDDPRDISNVSVWETPTDLENYVFKTVHAQFYKKRANWFEKMSGPHMVFWWVPEGHQPSIAEAMQRLADFESNGASDHAFGWSQVIDKERWHAQRCA